MPSIRTTRPSWVWRLLLLLVFVISLAVPVFNRAGPTLFGFPFFYWYQMAAVPVASVLIFIVFLVEDRPDTAPGDRP